MKVWLVEDDDLVAIPFTMWIERLGHDVTHYRRASEVMAALDGRERPDMLVTDLTLPGMNGTDLIREVRSQVEGVPVVLMSGHAVDADSLGLAPPFEFLPKPVDLDRLQTVLGQFASARR